MIQATGSAEAGSVEDLRPLHGGRLPPGSYRYVEAQRESRPQGFEIGGAGELLD